MRSQDKAKEQRQNVTIDNGAKHRIEGGEGSIFSKRKRLEHPIIGEEWGNREPLGQLREPVKQSREPDVTGSTEVVNLYEGEPHW